MEKQQYVKTEVEKEIEEILRIANIVKRASNKKTIFSVHINAAFEIQKKGLEILKKCQKNISNQIKDYDYDLFLDKLKCINCDISKNGAIYLAPIYYEKIINL